MTAGVGGLAAVNPRVFDDGVVNDQLGARRLRVERHSLGGRDALTLGVEPFHLHWLTDSCGGGRKVKDNE